MGFHTFVRPHVAPDAPHIKPGEGGPSGHVGVHRGTPGVHEIKIAPDAAGRAAEQVELGGVVRTDPSRTPGANPALDVLRKVKPQEHEAFIANLRQEPGADYSSDLRELAAKNTPQSRQLMLELAQGRHNASFKSPAFAQQAQLQAAEVMASNAGLDAQTQQLLSNAGSGPSAWHAQAVAMKQLGIRARQGDAAAESIAGKVLQEAETAQVAARRADPPGNQARIHAGALEAYFAARGAPEGFDCRLPGIPSADGTPRTLGQNLVQSLGSRLEGALRKGDEGLAQQLSSDLTGAAQNRDLPLAARSDALGALGRAYPAGHEQHAEVVGTAETVLRFLQAEGTRNSSQRELAAIADSIVRERPTVRR